MKGRAEGGGRVGVVREGLGRVGVVREGIRVVEEGRGKRGLISSGGTLIFKVIYAPPRILVYREHLDLTEFRAGIQTKQERKLNIFH